MCVSDDDDDALREAVPLAEREKSWAAYNRAKGFAGGGRHLVVVKRYPRQDALLYIVRERPKGCAKRRRHVWILALDVQLYQLSISFAPMRPQKRAAKTEASVL